MQGVKKFYATKFVFIYIFGTLQGSATCEVRVAECPLVIKYEVFDGGVES